MPSSDGYASDSGRTPVFGERGYRRTKLAAIANSVYKASATAVGEIKETYAQQRVRDPLAMMGTNTTIPGSFPDVAITVKGDDQMVIFPSYAKRHIKGQLPVDLEQQPQQQQQQQQPQQPQQSLHQQQQQQTQSNPEVPGTIRDEAYWRREWERMEDEKAIVDVDVRGWLYSPHKGALTRKNRLLLGLARQLSGIPVPQSNPNSRNDNTESLADQERIAKKAAEIERLGQKEKSVAISGGYSEKPSEVDDPDHESIYHARSRSSSPTPLSTPSSPALSAKNMSTAPSTELSEAELAVANANLMARIAPFLTTPIVQLPVTMFFYNETCSKSKSVMTNEAGHFIMRAALDFVPTHVRVLANEDLSAIQEIKIIEPEGVSLISDIDDTIKRSNISLGAKEIFRNTFIRELGDLTVDGVKEWYNKMHSMGVSIHYCSNSPWQLFPVLASYFATAGLPPGSLHLKQYSGMLQGIFEPVAERKKSVLVRLLHDFPQRKFLLVGDSGEADLEVYTDLAVSYPGRILAIMIRDVTSPENVPGYFDSSFETAPARTNSSSSNSNNNNNNTEMRNKPAVPSEKPAGPTMGQLIDFSSDPEPPTPSPRAPQTVPRKVVSASAVAPHKPSSTPPPRPVKPLALRSASSPATTPEQPPTRPSKPSASVSMHPLAQMQPAPPQPKPTPPPPRRTATPLASASSSTTSLAGRHRAASNSDVDFQPLAPAAHARGHSYSGRPPAASSGAGSANAGGAVNKKLDLWQRRLARAHEVLAAQGVALYTWRRGDDVVHEAVGIARRALGGGTR